MTDWLPGGGRFRSARFHTAQGAGRGNDPRFRDRFRIAAAAGFGNTWTLGEVANYYAGINQIEHITEIPGSDDVVIMNGTTGGVLEGVCRITSGGGGTPVWRAQPVSNMRGSGDTHDLLAATATHVFALYRFGANYRISKLDVGSGAEQWYVDPGSTRNVNLSSDGAILLSSGAGANSTREWDASSATTPSTTSYTLGSPSGTILAAVLTDDDSTLVTMDNSEQLCFHRMADRPGGGGAWTTAINRDLTSHPASPWGSVTGGAWASPSRDGNNGIWIASESNQDLVLKYDLDGNELPGSGITPKTDLEAELGPSTVGMDGIWTDKYGFLYVFMHATSPLRNHVLKYTNEGELVTSTAAQGLAPYDTDQALGIGVSDTSGIIWLIFDDGFTQQIDVS